MTKDAKEKSVIEFQTSDQRDKAIMDAMAVIEKRFGTGTIMDMGKPGARVAVETISSGSLSLNHALGIGGYPRGRIMEFYGAEASGKTTLALHAIAEVQRQGGRALFIDAEHALDPAYAERLGVRLDRLLLSQPDYGEQALEIAEVMIRSGGFDVIVIDSVAALVPKAEIDGDMGDSHMGLQARMMSQAMRKITGCASQSKTAVIFINQTRMKIGVVFGNPETTTGGMALKFHASVRLDIKRKATIKEGEEVVGNEAQVTVVKNKLAPPLRRATFDIIYGRGIVRSRELLDLGVQYNVVEKRGAYYAYGDVKLGQGKTKAQETLEGDDKLMDQIEAGVREAMKQ